MRTSSEHMSFAADLQLMSLHVISRRLSSERDR
jgi:hypothetical protein